MRQLCECAYRRLDAGAAGKAPAQSLAPSFLLIAREVDETTLVRPGSEDDAEMADRIRRYLHSMALSQVAGTFRCSESYVSHVFKSCIGSSPIQYVTRRRIGLA